MPEPEDELYITYLTEKEIDGIGRQRYADEHRKGTFAVALLMILTIIYILGTIPLSRWFVLGVVVPLGIMWIIGIRQGHAAKQAGREEIARVKADPENQD